MRLSTLAKILLATVIFPCVLPGCNWMSGDKTPTGTSPHPPPSELPFKTREPAVFQTQIVIQTFGNERRLLVARDGLKRRIDFDVGTDDHRAIIISDKEYLLFFKRRVYQEHQFTTGGSAENELAAHLLFARDHAEFEELGRDGTVVQYRARINGSETSEVRIFYDEQIGLPVKQEFYSLGGDERKLQFSVELRDFQTAVDAKLFEVPQGFTRTVVEDRLR